MEKRNIVNIYVDRRAFEKAEEKELEAFSKFTKEATSFERFFAANKDSSIDRLTYMTGSYPFSAETEIESLKEIGENRVKEIIKAFNDEGFIYKSFGDTDVDSSISLISEDFSKYIKNVDLSRRLFLNIYLDMPLDSKKSLEEFDTSFANIMNTLKDHNILNNSIIAILGDRNYEEIKTALCPFSMYMGSDSKTLVKSCISVADIMPSIESLLNINLGIDMEGEDISMYIESPIEDLRKHVMSFEFPKERSILEEVGKDPMGFGKRYIFTQSYCYLVEIISGDKRPYLKRTLFAMDIDPKLNHPLNMNSPENIEYTIELEDEMHEMMRDRNDRFTVNMKRYAH